MAKKWKVWVEPKAVFEIMKSDEMQKILREEAEKVVGRAGEGYEANVRVGSKRAVANIAPTTPKAYNSNLKNNTLLKALGGGK